MRAALLLHGLRTQWLVMIHMLLTGMELIRGIRLIAGRRDWIRGIVRQTDQQFTRLAGDVEVHGKYGWMFLQLIAQLVQ